ncbi:MAG TPA: FecR domain-containing protein [Acidobacteriota bacterium]|nr:FecR domain-containing protein [Acidobacteriota bacterium]
MTRRVFVRLLALVSTLTLLPLALWAQTQAGAIKAVRLSGAVSKITANSTAPVLLTEGAALTESDTVTTDAESSVVLVFANGASVKLGPNSRLAIEEFKMDPLPEQIAVANLEGEPNVSKTRLNLAYGDLVGNVKKLNKSRGSEFNIKTPVGAAGIRGTTFRIVMRFEASGQVTFTLSTSEGTVAFTGTVQVSGTGAPTQDGAAQEVAVTDGQEVSAIATVNPVTNQITNVQVSSTQAISPAASEAITAAVTQAIQQAQQSTTFTQSEQQQAAQQTNTTSQSNDSGSNQQGTPKSDTQNQTQTTQQTPLDTSTRSGSG